MKIDSPLNRAFDTQLQSIAPDLPRPVAEHRFHEGRGWSFDRAWPRYKVAVELEGGSHGRQVICHNCGVVVRSITSKGSGRELRSAGYHGHRARFSADVEKYNVAQLDGWLVLRFVHDNVICDPFTMVEAIRQALERRAWCAMTVPPLSVQHDRILHLIAGGYQAREIADRLGITEASVRRAVDAILARLEVRNRPSAVAKAFVHGMIEPHRVAWTYDEAVLCGVSGSFLALPAYAREE